MKSVLYKLIEIDYAKEKLEIESFFCAKSFYAKKILGSKYQALSGSERRLQKYLKS